MTVPELIQHVFDWVLWCSAGAAALALLVLAAQWIVGSRISARWRYNLWVLVVVRLLMPALPAVQISVPPWTAAHSWWNHSQSVRETFPISRVRSEAEPRIPVARPDPGLAFAPHPAWADAHPLPNTLPQPTRAELAPVAFAHQRSMTLDIWQVIPFAWLAGVILLLGRVAFVTLRLAHLTQNLHPLDDPAAYSLLHDCCHRLRVRSPPALLIGPDHLGPALVGVWRPRLLLPPCVLSFEPSELRLILLHELAHLRRRDVLANYGLSMLQTVHWFNPLVWLAFSRMRADRELACDEMVLSATSLRESRTYASTILKLLELLSQGTVSSGAVGAIQRKALMHRRIAMIARFDGKPRRQTVRAVLLMLGIGIVGVASLVRADPPVSGSDAANHPSSAGASEIARTDAALRIIEDPASLRADEQTLEKLRKPTSLALESESLSDVLAKFADVAKVDIVTDNRTLARELGADFAKNPITFRVHEPRPVGDLLQLALRLVSGNLDYAIVDGVVFVSTRDELARHVVTRIYRVDSVGNSGELANAIAQVLRSQAAHPEIQFVGPRLIVTAPEPAQRQIAKLLHILVDPASRSDTRPANADGDQRVAQVYLLKYADARHMADIVASVFPAEVKCTADDRSNALIVHAMPDDQAIIERLLSLLDKPERHEHAAANSLSGTATELLRKYRDTAEQLAIGRAKYGGSSHPEVRLLRVQLNVQGQEIKAILDELVRTGQTGEADSLRRQWQALDTLADATMVGSDGATETRRYNLKSADPKAVAAAVASQCSPAAKISVDPQTKALVVTASAAEQARVVQVLIDQLSPATGLTTTTTPVLTPQNIILSECVRLGIAYREVVHRYGPDSQQAKDIKTSLYPLCDQAEQVAEELSQSGHSSEADAVRRLIRNAAPDPEVRSYFLPNSVDLDALVRLLTATVPSNAKVTRDSHSLIVTAPIWEQAKMKDDILIKVQELPPHRQ